MDSSGVVQYPPVEVGMTLEEIGRAEADIRRLQADPAIKTTIYLRRSERRKLDDYGVTRGLTTSDAGRELIRQALMLWEGRGKP